MDPEGQKQMRSVVQVRVHPKDKNRLTAYAATQGLTLSELARRGMTAAADGRLASSDARRDFALNRTLANALDMHLAAIKAVEPAAAESIEKLALELRAVANRHLKVTP